MGRLLNVDPHAGVERQRGQARVIGVEAAFGERAAEGALGVEVPLGGREDAIGGNARGVGAAIWGVGASLGFPVGMSAAADEPARAPMRISVVSTIGYGAFLAGPPLLGLLGESFGILRSLLVVGAMAAAAILVVPAAKPPVGSTPVGH